MTVPARLALADGSTWHGVGFGAPITQVGEVVFNTSLTGYQEIITDPSYAGQIVVMTAPQIGNTGINEDDMEARRSFMRGLLARDLSPVTSNWRSSRDLAGWLSEQGIPALSEIDTRALTQRLREQGSMNGVISSDESLSDADLIEQARAWPGLDGVDLVKEVTCTERYRWADPTAAEWRFRLDDGEEVEAGSLHVVAYDYGIKINILRRLAAHGCRVTVVPADTPADEVISMNPDGVFLSNGPGDPSVIRYGVTATQVLLGQVPIFGICLGHQILGQALGAETYRMKFGHHGGNQPVKHLPSGRVEISAHNHNFAVNADTLPADIEMTHLNLNDECCEGLRHRTLPALSIQYHPEAAPGPHDADPLFAEFVQLMKEFKQDA